MDETTHYLREVLGGGRVATAEILRLDGSVRAATGPFLTTVREGRQLAGLFESPGDAVAAGITVGGVTYVAAEADGHLLHGKRGAAGVVAVKNPPFIVVGLYGEGHRPADAVLAVGNLADRLAAGLGTAPPSPPPGPGAPHDEGRPTP
ncbi:profilin [Streptomyces sp. NPDC058662]|uniref:profilin n=1 Tax=Streptomyces sp. NPDC058662 TaxID=3346583 RepID=UPI003660731F